MKQSMELRVSQQLTMTPQLQQAIRLLQLSSLELQTEITETIEANPLLELEEEGAGGLDEEPTHNERLANSIGQETSQGQEPVDDRDMDFQQNEEIPAELDADTNWEDTFMENAQDFPPSSAANQDREYQDFSNDSDGPETLNEYLLAQLAVTPMSDIDRLVAEAIIDGVDESGYLTSSLEDIMQTVDAGLELDDVEPVLHLLQRFDPPGVAARDLRECLLLQLEQVGPRTPAVENAVRLVANHLQLLASHEPKKLQRDSGLTDDELRAAMGVIRTLDPRPGNAISPTNTEYIVPDVIVSKRGKTWQVELNPAIIPKLRINPFYAGMIKKRDNSDDNNYLKNQLNEARWFINSVKSRHTTLLNVARCIVKRQAAFFEHGPLAMQPMVLHDIAAELALHESTISRVTSKKYMLTPKTIYELKYFFSSHVGTADGGLASATAMRTRIKEMTDAEGETPLSDSKIAALLEKEGFHVARRTVAKYREAMHIPPSSERKKSIYLS